MICEPLRDVLTRYQIKHVDFMSLDVEGHELAVLHGINWQVKLACIEGFRFHPIRFNAHCGPVWRVVVAGI